MPEPLPPTGSATTTPATPTGPTPPSSRDLRPPHFLLRTPDGLGSYFDRENQRIIMSPHEPLAGFLAPAALVDDKAPAPGRAKQRIEYDLSGIDATTFAPADPVPAAVAARFEEAARAFYARVDDPNSRANDHEKRLRRAFRLPDPDKEPDAYWICGPRDDRRLIILWGCEAVRGSSLPLCARAEAGNAPGVLEKLRKRGIRWAHLQKEALALIIEKRRPLARFLATPVRDRTGALTAVIWQGKSLPREKFKPLKHLGSGEIRAFEQEAAAFYAGLRAGAEGVTAYERELRLAFRLPDPDKRPGQFFVSGGKLFIVLQGDETPDTSLCPGPDAEIPMPPEEKGPDGAAFVPETVVDRLRTRATPVKQRLIIAGVALVALLGTLWAFDLMADRTPPRIERVVAENDPTTVRVTFDEAIDPRSLGGSEEFPEPLRVRDPNGRYITASSIVRDEKDERVVVLKVEPLGPGGYEVVAKGVRDASRKRNAIKAEVTKGFEFTDTLPPDLATISAHPEQATRLVLVFNEPLDPAAMRNRDNYQVPGFTVRSIEAGQQPGEVVLTVDKPFENRGRYSLRVEGITDRSQNMPRGPIERDFQYVDTIPPLLERVEAVASQVRVLVHFSKRLGPGADNPGLYRVEAATEGGGWEPVEVRLARLPDESRPVVELVTAPLKNGTVYRLTARGVPDRAAPPNLLAASEPKEFRFTGREDKTPPGLGRARVREGTNNREVEVAFSEEVTEESALRAENYSFVERSVPIEAVTSADSAMIRQVVLRLAMPLPQGSRLTVRASGLSDFVGNVNEDAVSEPFWVSGMGMIEDTTLRLVSATARANGTQVALAFNEKLLPGPAQTPSNFGVSGGRRVARIEFDPAKPTELVLVLDGSTPLTAGGHSVTVRNLILAELPESIQHSVSRPIEVR